MAAKEKGAKTKKTETPKKAKQAVEPYLVKYPHLLNSHYTADEINAYADASLDYYRSNPTELSISRFFTINNIPRASYSRFPERSEYFASVWQLLKEEQKERITKKLPDRENSTAGLIFIMKNVSDWRDQPDTEPDTDHELSFTGFNAKSD